MKVKLKSVEILITVLLAAFGALARLLNQKEKLAVHFANLFSGCLVASFAGLMAYFLSQYLLFPTSMVYVFAGISGWMGPHMLDLFGDVLMNKLGLKTKTAETASSGQAENEKK